MMLREIIKPKKATFTMKLPEEMVGKTVEVIAFEITEKKSVLTKEQKLKQIEDTTKNSLVDLSSFKFDRDAANDYQE